MKILSWSFSRWAAYDNCPFAAKLKFVDKLQEPSSPALARGTELHTLCEEYLRGVKKTVPKEVKPIEKYLKDLKKRGAIPEAEFAFDKNWNPVTWFSKDAWVRIKADVVVDPVVDDEVPTVCVDDFKSGGKLQPDGSVVGRDEYPVQLRLYALAGLKTRPTAQKARTRLIFIDHGKDIPMEDEFTQKDVKLLQKEWEMRTKKMLSDTAFKPKPGNACRWCHFRKANGGPCQF